MDRSAVILAGGASSRFGEDKGLVKLEGKPLLNYVVDAVKGLVQEIIVVTNSKERVELYGGFVSSKVRFAIDVCESRGPLVGALSGLEAAGGDYTVLLPFDNPFVSRPVVSLLFDLCVGKSAVVPRWTNNQIEPLHAVYNTKTALEAAKQALEQDELDLNVMIGKMRGVRYVSTLVLEQLDPDLRTFFNVNTPLDLKKAASMLKMAAKPRKNK